MSTQADSRDLRAKKLDALTAIGLPYFPARFGPNRSSIEVVADFPALEGARVRVAGRVMRIRNMGKAAFAHIQDRDGQIQLYFKKDILGDAAFEYFLLLDLGDVIGVEGTVFRTRTGEVSIEVAECTLLAKAFLTLPEKWHGLTDVEVRYRKRYLDLISNDDARTILRRRSAVVSGLRRCLDGRGFTEVETPILQPVYGGGAAIPFVTRSETIDSDVFLRISDELYLKRLIVGGMERVYEIGKDFRNEGVSRKHSNEFTMLELYQAYANYHDMMDLLEILMSNVAHQVVGSPRVTYQGAEIDFSPPWERLTLSEAILRTTGIDIETVRDVTELSARARAKGAIIPSVEAPTRGKLIDDIFSSLVEPHLIQPTILYDHPIDFPGGLLAKRNPQHPDLVERFEAFVGGFEIANAFSELNDPRDQTMRMKEAGQLSGEEYQQIDFDYIEALEHGMPPTGGMGIGIDRVVMLMTDAHHIRETILFPLLRPKEDVHAES